MNKVVFLSDSQIVLSWIRKNPSQHDLGRLVNNRIKELRRITSELTSGGMEVLFGYIPSDSYPADAGTRGLSKEQIVNHHWWTGPSILRDPPPKWNQTLFSIESAEPTSEVIAFNVSVSDCPKFPWNRYSSLIKAQRVMAWSLRFLSKLVARLPSDHQQRICDKIPALRNAHSEDDLTGNELRMSKVVLIKLHQQSFTEDYKKSMDKTLKLFEDSEGLWRIRGRLGLSTRLNLSIWRPSDRMTPYRRRWWLPILSMQSAQTQKIQITNRQQRRVWYKHESKPKKLFNHRMLQPRRSGNPGTANTF
ncbi:hypothetical protein ANCCAN_07909 [Ancylostoma caninum]|uniref:Uncharacterized protein n=1 Tax=Ancylostoma caninum TaxID=29170 RepID=A0A368GNU1_ANCCA|nr:hypothetical protein ANCCAN_07909 [Ancylostoma caninum]